VPRALILSGAGAALVIAALWAVGALAPLAGVIEEAQRAAQSRLAGAVRDIRAGAPGALAGLLAVSFGYGVLHAAGPGHGKVLIGGYGIGRRVPALRLSALAVVSSLAQAAVAVALVYALLAMLGLARQSVVDLSEGAVTAVGNVLIAALGVWLLWRGAAALQRLKPALAHGHADAHPPDDPAHEYGHDHAHDHHQDHDHDHDHHHDHAHCGHAHGPSAEDVAALTGWRDTALLVGGIAARPCSGALFLLIVTWQFGIGAAGILGAFAMGLGVASVTVAVALAAVWAREGAFAALSGGRIARAMPLAEMAAGALLLVLTLPLVWRALG
jgi:nickel/cobalt transporter (NicO) family protein